MSEQLHPIQIEIFRRMTAAEKLAVWQRLYETAWELKRAGFRAQFSDLTEAEIEAKVREAFRHAAEAS